MEKNKKDKKFGLMFVVLGAAAFVGFVLFFILSFSPAVVVQYARDSNNGLVTDHNKNFPGTLVNSRDKKIRMAFFGDLMIDRNVKTKIDKYGMDYLFEKVASSSVWQDISDSDLIMANLEGAVTDDGQHYRPEMSYDFAFAPDRIKQLADYGFDAFNIANNHLADQGENGIMETDENLEKLGIFYFGCADQQVGECSVKVKEIDGKKLVGLDLVWFTERWTKKGCSLELLI